ncbi:MULTISPECIES: peptide ligase PGM1-related protein [Streptomyces]|uniref:peptide ligase PGM1-related protein n=1 Tax=Streptomyces TaxID=1883 RepID=UPI0029B08170|nr:peptide ligase PGM1-related protein [Streptomyces sp. AK02-04a]MDX3762437.1 peptide ligase PGM1-related protein [Streptomyces sp. AK02-04a]
MDWLTAAKLAYDPRTGVIVASAYDKEHQGVMDCVVAPDIDMAWDLNDELNSLFGTDS